MRSGVHYLFVFAFSVLVGIEGGAVSTNQVSARFLGQKVSLERGGTDLTPKIGQKARVWNARKLKEFQGHKRDDVFYSCRGDVLKWGVVDDYVSLLLKVSPLSLPPQATVEQIEKITANARRKLAEGAGNEYLQNCLMISQIRASGITIPEAEILQAISNSVRRVRGSFKAEVLAASLQPEGYLYRKQTGYLLMRKYFEKVVKSQITVSDAEIAKKVAERNQEIADAIAYNATLRPKIELLRKEILSGKRDFVEAVDKFSDCDSSVDDGVLGEYTPASCSLHKNLKAFIFAPSTDEYSEIIETPYSYHLVKILSRRYDKVEDEDEEGDVEGEEENTEAGKMDSSAPSPKTESLESSKSGLLAAKVGGGLVLLFLVSLFFVKGRLRLIVGALVPLVLVATVLTVWRSGGAALFKANGGRVPTKVKVAHLMLEKHEVDETLDSATARILVRNRKAKEAVRKLQRDFFAQVSREKDFKCDFKVNFLKENKKGKGQK